MSRALSCSLALIGALVATLLGGCAGAPPAQVINNTPAEIVNRSAVQDLLTLQENVARMSVEQADEALAATARPGPGQEGPGQERPGQERPDAARELFYYGLLNQRSASYSNWIVARDVFRQLRKSDGMSASEQQLAGILERYNQNRINAQERQRLQQQQYDELQQQLADSAQQKALLEQKIQAITDLEAAISTRKEQ